MSRWHGTGAEREEVEGGEYLRLAIAYLLFVFIQFSCWCFIVLITCYI